MENGFLKGESCRM